MPSLDYLEDLKDKLEEDNLDYFMVVISRGKTKNNANVSFKLSKKHTIKTLKQVLHRLDIDGAIESENEQL
tara:strand:- start:134 stop:346 length:213 start_codon:yes stop_codon:yes gene_type:complete